MAVDTAPIDERALDPSAVEELSPDRPSLLSRILPTAAAFVAVFVLFFASPTSSRSDPLWVPYSAQSLLDDHDLDLSDRGLEVGDDYALIEDDGQVVSYFPWTTAALTVPIVVVHRALEPTGMVVPLDEQLDRMNTGDFQRLAGGLFAAAAAVVLAHVSRRLIRMSRHAGPTDVSIASTASAVEDRAWFLPACALILGLGTSLWSTASRGLWQHGPGILLLGGAWLAALHLSGPSSTGQGRSRSDRWLPLLSGGLAGLACGVRPTNAVLAIALGAFVAWRRRDALVPWILGGLGVAVLGMVANLVLLGSLLPTYFSAGRAGLHSDFLVATLSDLLGPSRGLLVFSPWLVLALVALLPSRARLLGSDVCAFAWCAAAGALGSLLAAASYGEHWWAGHSYGPRFLSETLVVLGPLALVVVFGPRPTGRAARLLSVVVAPVLVVASVALHAPGALTEVTDCWSRTPVDVDASPRRVNDWSDPQFVAGWRTLVDDGVGAAPDACQDRRR